MAFLPITLVGDNLGQRQRHLNSLVRKAKMSGPSFRDVKVVPEESPVDRLFKIDLAMELKHVDYIICSLKDNDMLYVSRALKSTWLIDHRDIINPKYLEDILFPEMIKPAVTKMKHWLYINLRDPAMCQEFYQYYKENAFELAIKFLSHCSHEFILTETPKILSKLSPHSLKVLCEKCPKVGSLFFDSLSTDEDVKTCYLKQDRAYYNSVKCVLKSDADLFLNITEKYFNIKYFGRFSPLATDYIVRYHKTRFTNKLELYVAYLLHIPTLAARLSVEECQEVVLKLAQASYLQHWFEYKIVEPLIKRVSPAKRAAFKKQVFVDKDVGDCVDNWPYELPAPPTIPDIGLHIFDDHDCISPVFRPLSSGGCVLFGATSHPCAIQPEGLAFTSMIRVKTDLDRLFDEFRFIGFERALHELGQRLGAVSSTDRRRDIFLVLVSKTGGRTDAVSALLRLAARHINEPPHTRASIVRSLVKRAKAWRLPADVWQNLLDYGHGLGLDGTVPEAACREGLHAVVIRQLLAGECEQIIRDTFMNDFSTLVEYSLKANERVRVAKGLQNLLTEATVDVEPSEAAYRLHQLLDVLKIYRVRLEPTSPAVKAVETLALRDATVARPLLARLYDEKIARRELLKFNMEFRKDEAALLNALRHDPSVLESNTVADVLAGWNQDTGHRSFVSHPMIYPQPTNFGSSMFQPFGFGSTAAPPTRFSFGIPAPPELSDTRPGTSGSTTAPPISYSFGSPAGQPPVDGRSADQPLVFGSTAAPSTGFSFGIPAPELSNTRPGSSGSPTAPPISNSFGSPAGQPPADGRSADQPLVFGSSTSQQVIDNRSGDQPTIDGNSAEPPTVNETGAVQPTAFITSTVQTAAFSSFSAQPMGLGGIAPPRFPYRRFRRFSARQPSFDVFTSKLGIYFNQKQDFTTPLRTILKEKITQGQDVKLARPFACLFGSSFQEELHEFDVVGKDGVKFAAALRACAHRARPVVNLAEWGWRKAGVKAVATRAMRCREIERDTLTQELAADRRTVKVALALSLRSPSKLFIETLKSTAMLRPSVALGAGLLHFHRCGDSSDLKVWEIIKPLLSSVDLKPRARLRNLIRNIDWIPATIKPDYCIALYHALYKISRNDAQTVLRDLSQIVPKFEESIENILLQMLDDEDDKDYSALPYLCICVRYLLLSRNEDDVEKRFVKIGNRLIERLDKLRNDNDYRFHSVLDETLKCLKYNSAFLDTKFSSCLSVIERILTWLQTFMPREQYFKINTQVHLTMLYFKAVRESMKQMPEVFADPKMRKSEGVEAVGFLFGRYIVKEVAELASSYFDSMFELYTDPLVDYLNDYFVDGTSKKKFIGFVLKGILTEAEGIQRRLAVYVFKKHQLGVEDSMRKEIEELLMKDRSIEILVHAESFHETVPIVPYFNNFRVRN